MERLTIKVYAGVYEDGWSWNADRLTDYMKTVGLSSSTNPSLLQVTINMFGIDDHTSQLFDPHSPSVKSLDALLVSVIHQSLIKQITFEWTQHTGERLPAGAKHEYLTSLLRKAFPTFDEQGMLRIQ